MVFPFRRVPLTTAALLAVTSLVQPAIGQETPTLTFVVTGDNRIDPTYPTKLQAKYLDPKLVSGYLDQFKARYAQEQKTINSYPFHFGALPTNVIPCAMTARKGGQQ